MAAAQGKRVLITSALPYVNNVPHLGNIIGCVLSADVYARFCRMRGYETVFVAGTDEYGTTTEQRAMLEHTTPEEICKKYYEIHRGIYEWFDISTDRFGRTSTPQQTVITQDIFRKLDSNGYITQNDVEQHFCPKCERFLADRFVEGTCPLCKAPGARGDQCDSCQKLYDAAQLIDPKCKTCGTSPVMKTSRHLFIDLPALGPKLAAYVERAAQDGRWTSNSVQVAKAWLKDLRPRCITRDLKWGTPVPKPGFENKVFYVWFDAPIGYISITAGLRPNDWQDWWKAGTTGNVRLVQFMGKDNLPFHTIIFPATLLGTGDPWTLMDSISTTEYLNYEGTKFSKSCGTGVFGDDAIKTGIPSEVWRYYLLINRPESADSEFTWVDLAEKNNNELLKNLGNFANRGLAFLASAFAKKVPAAPTKEQLQPIDVALFEEVDKLLAQYVDQMEKIKIKDGLKIVMEISRAGNKYMQDTAPWVLAKENQQRCGHVMNIITNLNLLIATVAEPFIPGYTRKVRCQAGLTVNPTVLPTTFVLNQVPEGHIIGDPAPIFRKLDDGEIKAWRAKFGEQKKGDSPAGVAAAASTSKPKAPSHAAKGGPVAADLRVGLVESAEPHPSADKLYVLKVNVGEDKPRQVVSGIRGRYPDASKLVGSKVVLVCNLKPSKLRDVMSEGMVLTGDPATAEGEFVLCEPADKAAVQPGAVIVAEGSVPPAEGYSIIDIKSFAKLAFNITNGQAHLDKAKLVILPSGTPVIAPGVNDGKIK